ncbi:MAG: beta-ketoacyl-[acyl-carrier-protein] synthase family protein [Actinophytocola sp.]|uniref:beta-ketoacyl-[acyl-carrier-protein] synthase family protein n=1 Tax=Actinophytocola sp. TaxID=1872138 RepID=UPI003C76ED21
MTESVLITGIGAITAGARGVDEFWHNIRQGRTRIGTVARFAELDLPTWVGGEIQDSQSSQQMAGPPDGSRRETSLAIAAVGQALADARLTDRPVSGDRIGMVGSSSRGPLAWWQELFRGDGEPSGRSAVLHSLNGASVGLAAIAHDVRGSVTTVSNACVGGNQAVGIALSALRSGEADLMIVVGCEFPLVPSLIRIYAAMGKGALSTARSPEGAMRPYDINRNGFVLGEGVVVLCLERADSALRRGITPYAEVLGHRSRSEANHPMHMDLSGQHAADLVREVLAASGNSPGDVGYYCGHGSATHYNDLAEGRMLDVLYRDSPRSQPPLGSVKAVYGHLLGGAGVVNVAATALMLSHQVLAPTVGCRDVDPECGPDHVVGGPRNVDLRVAVSLSFAVGSQSSAVALAACE